jgi:CheY-like chemotaxis protein
VSWGSGSTRSRWPLRILVAEDDADLALVYGTYLQSSGHAISVARDGRAVLEAVTAFSPDLLILDLMLPLLPGVEVLERIRAKPSTRSLPVVVFSNAEPPPLTARKLLELGIEASILKVSMTPSELAGWLERWRRGEGTPVRRRSSEQGEVQAEARGADRPPGAA